MGTAPKNGTKLTTLVHLTPEEIKALPRPRQGFLAYARPLIAIYRAHPDEVPVSVKVVAA